MNKKGSFIATLIVIIIILAVVGYLGYRYVYPDFKNANLSKGDLSEDDKYYGYSNFSIEDIKLKMPETWTKFEVDDVSSSNSWVYKVNPSSNEDFMYVWRYGYAFDSKALAKEIVQYNIEEISEQEVNINGNAFYNVVVSVQEESVTRIYNTYAFVKNGIGYVFTLKCNSEIYDALKDKFKNSVESVEFQ